MRMLLLAALCLLAAGLGGCASKPLSDSEFRGFCYTAIGHRTSCDTISLCNEYDADVLSVKHASRQACGEGCQAVYNRLYTPNLFDGCSPTVLMAFNWCKKYCNTNYDE